MTEKDFLKKRTFSLLSSTSECGVERPGTVPTIFMSGSTETLGLGRDPDLKKKKKYVFFLIISIRIKKDIDQVM